jgi:hypothetical protein
VRALRGKANRAFEKAEEASKLVQQGGHDADAARLMHEAAAMYPQATNLAIAAEMYDEGAAFERKDYDTFLSIARQQWKIFPGPETAGVVASALACKYAVTGDEQYKKQSEEMLLEAERGSQQAEQKKRFEEYAERIRYRLARRVIIDKPEYDKKFRSQKTSTE